MEITFNHMSYTFKNKSFTKEIFHDIDFSIKEGNIISFIGEDVSYLQDLLLLKKRPSQGELIINGVKIKKTNHINCYNGIDKSIGVLEDISSLSKKTVKEYIQSVMESKDCHLEDTSKHIRDSLQIVGLSLSFLEREIKSLSFTEKKKVSLAALLSYNPKIIILNRFAYGLSFKEQDYLKKLLLKLKNTFHKTILLLNERLPFLFALVDNVYVIHKGEVQLVGDKNVFYDYNLYRYVDVPAIVSFTKYVHDSGYALQSYTDIKELIKEIYRRIK